MNAQKFTEKSMEAIRSAQNTAQEYGNQSLEIEHLLFALITQKDGLIPEILDSMSVDEKSFSNDVLSLIQKFPKVKGGDIYLSQSLDGVLNASENEAEKMKDDYISVEHIFLSIIDKATQSTKAVLNK